MRSPKTLTLTLTAIVAAMMFATPAISETVSDRSTIRVSARVGAYLQSEVELEPLALQITEDDVRNGYVEVSGGRLQVKTNNPQGYFVAFSVSGGVAKSVEVIGFDQKISLGTTGGYTLESYRGTTPVVRDMTYRITLADTVAAGTYSWPVRVAVNKVAAASTPVRQIACATCTSAPVQPSGQAMR